LRKRGDGGMPRTAVDTNIVVRLLARDDQQQLQHVERLLEEGIIVESTVLLEVEWVLRARFRFDRTAIGHALVALRSLPSISFAEPHQVDAAIEWHAAGMDFADALHLAGAADYDEFVTFDEDLARKAAAVDSIPVRLL
jgi:predicted nucleic-acid-binding protein